jgi:hypothetical protein
MMLPRFKRPLFFRRSSFCSRAADDIAENITIFIQPLRFVMPLHTVITLFATIIAAGARRRQRPPRCRLLRQRDVLRFKTPLWLLMVNDARHIHEKSEQCGAPSSSSKRLRYVVLRIMLFLYARRYMKTCYACADSEYEYCFLSFSFACRDFFSFHFTPFAHPDIISHFIFFHCYAPRCRLVYAAIAPALEAPPWRRRCLLSHYDAYAPRRWRCPCRLPFC